MPCSGSRLALGQLGIKEPPQRDVQAAGSGNCSKRSLHGTSTSNEPLSPSDRPLGRRDTVARVSPRMRPAELTANEACWPSRQASGRHG